MTAASQAAAESGYVVNVVSGWSLVVVAVVLFLFAAWCCRPRRPSVAQRDREWARAHRVGR